MSLVRPMAQSTPMTRHLHGGHPSQYFTHILHPSEFYHASKSTGSRSAFELYFGQTGLVHTSVWASNYPSPVGHAALCQINDQRNMAPSIDGSVRQDDPSILVAISKCLQRPLTEIMATPPRVRHPCLDYTTAGHTMGPAMVDGLERRSRRCFISFFDTQHSSTLEE